MRPYLVLCAMVLATFAAFGQEPTRRLYDAGVYGFGPYVPLLTTPMLSLENVSPNPVGASNATTGLVAGATNSTLSQLEGATSSDYTAAVWYQGGAPLIAPEVRISPEPIEGKLRPKHRWMGQERGGQEAGPRHEARGEWLYFTGSEYTAGLASSAKGPGKGSHKYAHDDVSRQNENNGSVRYDGKNEKIQ